MNEIQFTNEKVGRDERLLLAFEYIPKRTVETVGWWEQERYTRMKLVRKEGWRERKRDSAIGGKGQNAEFSHLYVSRNVSYLVWTVAITSSLLACSRLSVWCGGVYYARTQT